MAERRMFSKAVIDCDMFRSMSREAQLLYIFMSMEADDDGFVSKPKGIQLMLEASDSHLQELVDNEYLIMFPRGLALIRHWKVQNYIQKDRYKPSHHGEKELVELDEHRVYQLVQKKAADPNQMADEAEVTASKASVSTANIDSAENKEPEPSATASADNQAASAGAQAAKLPPIAVATAAANYTSAKEKATASTNPPDGISKNAWYTVFSLYEDCIQPIPNMVVVDDLQSLCKDFGCDWVTQAIKVAARHNARSIRYISSVLNNWKNRGVPDPWNHPDKKQPKATSTGNRVDDIVAEAMEYNKKMEVSA